MTGANASDTRKLLGEKANWRINTLSDRSHQQPQVLFFKLCCNLIIPWRMTRDRVHRLHQPCPAMTICCLPSLYLTIILNILGLSKEKEAVRVSNCRLPWALVAKLTRVYEQLDKNGGVWTLVDRKHWFKNSQFRNTTSSRCNTVLFQEGRNAKKET